MAKRRREKATADPAEEQLLVADESKADPTLRPEAYAGYVPPVAVADAAREPPGNLRAEIAVVRALLADVLRVPLAPDKRAAVVGNLAATLVRLLRENRSLDGSEADQFEDAVKMALDDPAVGIAAARREATNEGEADGSTNR